MSLVADLASVLKCSHQHTAHASEQQPDRAVNESQCMPLQQPSTAQGREPSNGDASTSNLPNEPLTPASASAPKPSSWPCAYQAEAQGAYEAGQEQQLQVSLLQPSELSQPPLADMTQAASDCNSQSAAGSSSSERHTTASQILVSNEDHSDFAVSSKHSEASTAGQVDSLPDVPRQGPVASSTSEPEAMDAAPTPDRCIPCATLQAIAV